MKIPFLSFQEMHAPLRNEMLSVFGAFYDKGWYILGDSVRNFEQEYAFFNNTKFAVGVSNGLDALHLSLKALGVKEGDEVIVPSNTYIATVLAVSFTGATPVFAEPDVQTCNINPANIEAVISGRTKAVIPVHLYGQACDMKSIMDIAGKYNISVVEDNAQAHGAAWNDQVTGSWGNINATSFYPGKNLGALGDAGAVTTDSEELAQKVSVLRNYGSQKKYYNEVIGYNMRLDELQAAVLRVKLKHLKQWNSQRQQLADMYDNLLNGVGDLILPVCAAGATHVYHLYTVRTKYRDALQSFLKEKGVDTLIHYPVPPFAQEAYKDLGIRSGQFPIAEEMAATLLSLPLWPGMRQEQMELVAHEIKGFFSHHI
jgi:dTDP-4-amino-4,6-dideoxygalactose transaminase